MKYIAQEFNLAGDDLMGYTVEECPLCGGSTREDPDYDVHTYNFYDELGRLSFVYHRRCLDSGRRDNIEHLYQKLRAQVKQDLGRE